MLPVIKGIYRKWVMCNASSSDFPMFVSVLYEEMTKILKTFSVGSLSYFHSLICSLLSYLGSTCRLDVDIFLSNPTDATK